MRGAFDRVQRLLTDAPPAVPGRLKRTIYGPYFRWTSVDGMVDPFALEVMANPDLLPVERPFVAAHEWAHLAGYADESEANFVGWLTCLQGDARAKYSGWMFLYWQLSGEVSGADRTQLASMLESGPRRDIDDIAERLRRGRWPLLQRSSWQVYDQYLKANRVEAGDPQLWPGGDADFARAVRRRLEAAGQERRGTLRGESTKKVQSRRLVLRHRSVSAFPLCRRPPEAIPYRSSKTSSPGKPRTRMRSTPDASSSRITA